jgi:hypothetical protein
MLHPQLALSDTWLHSMLPCSSSPHCTHLLAKQYLGGSAELGVGANEKPITKAETRMAMTKDLFRMKTPTE